MARVHAIRIEPLTAEAFAPFGTVIDVRDRAPDYVAASGTQGWHVAFESGRPLVSLLRTPYQGLRFRTMERHFHVSQAFIPLGGEHAAVAVAPPSADRDGVPPLDDHPGVPARRLEGLRAPQGHVAQPRSLPAAPARHPLRDAHRSRDANGSDGGVRRGEAGCADAGGRSGARRTASPSSSCRSSRSENAFWRGIEPTRAQMTPSRNMASKTISTYCCRAASSTTPPRSRVPIVPLHASVPVRASKSRVSEMVRVGPETVSGGT